MSSLEMIRFALIPDSYYALRVRDTVWDACHTSYLHEGSILSCGRQKYGRDVALVEICRGSVDAILRSESISEVFKKKVRELVR